MNREFRRGDPCPSQLTNKHKDMRANSAQLGKYCVIGASVRGKLHIHNEVPRDDAFAVHSNPNGTWLAVAVSDGVGSRNLSRYGASYAVNKLCTRLLDGVVKAKHGKAFGLSALSQPVASKQPCSDDRLTDIGDSNGLTPQLRELEEVVRNAFRSTRVDVEEFAREQKVLLEDLHCTLLGLILNVETGLVGVGQIGDGLILGFTDEKKAVSLTESPIPDELGATYLLTQDNWEQYFRTGSLSTEEAQHFTTFYLMTDGVADDCQYGPPADILQRWANDMDREIRLLPFPKKTAQRLKRYLATYQAKGSFDDRTLVAVYRKEDE